MAKGLKLTRIRVVTFWLSISVPKSHFCENVLTGLETLLKTRRPDALELLYYSGELLESKTYYGFISQ